MYEKIKKYIETNHMISSGDLVIAGISGGSDSVAMLYLLKQYQQEFTFDIIVVHIHHGIRGEEADRDKEFVENLCKELKLPFVVKYYDVPSLAQKWKKGTEDTGRIVRKTAFEEVLRESNHEEDKCKIAVAHNQNDLAETMLHNLARGSGIKGLCSMKPRSGNIIRPILCLKRTEVEEYLRQCNVESILDSSNLSEEYTRNRLRHHVLPFLEKEINTQAFQHMAETARILSMADDYFTEEAEILLEKYKTEQGFLFTADFFEKKEILQAYVLQEAMEVLAENRQDISSVHIRKILEMQEKVTGREIQLPYKLRARKTYEGVVLAKQDTRKEKDKQAEEYPLPFEGRMECELGNYETKIFLNNQSKIEEKAYTKWFDYDKINENLCVRVRKTGDYIIVNQEGNRKKINRIFIDEKIPKEKRELVPLVALKDEILWIVGSRMSERYKITSSTKRILELRYQGGKEDE